MAVDGNLTRRPSRSNMSRQAGQSVKKAPRTGDRNDQHRQFEPVDVSDANVVICSARLALAHRSRSAQIYSSVCTNGGANNLCHTVISSDEQ